VLAEMEMAVGFWWIVVSLRVGRVWLVKLLPVDVLETKETTTPNGKRVSLVYQ
jgi:hypothetical protein